MMMGARTQRKCAISCVKIVCVICESGMTSSSGMNESIVERIKPTCTTEYTAT